MAVAPKSSLRRLVLPVDNRWGGGEISALDFGDPSRAPDMVFAHANGFNASTYRTLMTPLATAFRVIAPDLRGHGETRLPAPVGWRRNWHDLRDDLIALLDALPEGPQMVLAGHSMGAVAALMAAAERPDRVSRLVLFDPVILPRGANLLMRLPLTGRMARRYPLTRGALRRRRRFDSRESAIDAYRGRGAFRGWPDAVLSDYVSGGFRDADEGVELVCDPLWEAANYAAQGHDPRRALRRFSGPVTVLKAATGSACSLRPDEFAHVDVRMVAGGGHLFPMTHDAAAREALREALA